MNEQSLNLGDVNGHLVGRVLKETVRRAAHVIYAQRRQFESTVKQGYGGSMDDVFTSADTAAQEVYLRMFKECFPDCGAIGEEATLRISPKNGCTAYFTVDPLDGTKAFIRRQSHGVATMVALVDQGEVISAYIGDINANEVYGYRPGSSRVHRITQLNDAEELNAGDNRIVLGDAFGLLRDPVDQYSTETQQLMQRACKGYDVMGASIGTWTARLWKREVQFCVLRPGFETPWDSTPVIGISKKLGYVFLRPKKGGKSWERYEPALPTEVFERDHDMLVVHELDLPKLYLP